MKRFKGIKNNDWWYIILCAVLPIAILWWRFRPNVSEYLNLLTIADFSWLILELVLIVVVAIFLLRDR